MSILLVFVSKKHNRIVLNYKLLRFKLEPFWIFFT